MPLEPLTRLPTAKHFVTVSVDFVQMLRLPDITAANCACLQWQGASVCRQRLSPFGKARSRFNRGSGAPQRESVTVLGPSSSTTSN